MKHFDACVDGYSAMYGSWSAGKPAAATASLSAPSRIREPAQNGAASSSQEEAQGFSVVDYR